jgi:hypothetical protein
MFPVKPLLVLHSLIRVTVAGYEMLEQVEDQFQYLKPSIEYLQRRTAYFSLQRLGPIIWVSKDYQFFNANIQAETNGDKKARIN